MTDDATNQILAAIGSLRVEMLGSADGLRGQVGALDGRFGVLEDRFGALEGQFDGLGSKVADLTNRYDGFERRLDRVEFNLAALGQHLDRVKSEVMGRIDTLSDDITGFREDMAVNFGQVESVRRKHDHVRHELRDLEAVVAAMERQIQVMNGRISGIESRI